MLWKLSWPKKKKLQHWLKGLFCQEVITTYPIGLIITWPDNVDKIVRYTALHCRVLNEWYLFTSHANLSLRLKAKTMSSCMQISVDTSLSMITVSTLITNSKQDCLPKPAVSPEAEHRPYFLARAFMSQNQEVRVLMRPPNWSALPLFGSGTKTRIRVPAVIPKTGDT